MKSANQCLEPSVIPMLLSGEVSIDEATVAEDHLAACESCRSSIESAIADARWWHDTRQMLVASTAWSRRRIDEMVGTERTTNEQLVNLLGPTDDPSTLGRIGVYEIVGILGHGGMGVVFKGYDNALSRFVAIKMLLPHLAVSDAARKRFAREAQAAAAVVDDHVMAIHGVSEWRSVPYFVMPYRRGMTLQKRLNQNGPLELREILRIGMQSAKGLAAAHAQGIVHRDIKPANIFLDEGVERVQLMDFGLARAVDDASLTRSGALAGTPQYMSPEQARAEPVDYRSDLFSLGSVLYVMCTGQAPFRSESSYGVLRLITDQAPRPIRELNPDIPVWMCAIIGKLMAKPREDRFTSAGEVAELLEKCLAHIQQPFNIPLPAAALKVSEKFSRRLPVGKLLTTAVAFVFGLAVISMLIMPTQKAETKETKATAEAADNNEQPDSRAELVQLLANFDQQTEKQVKLRLVGNPTKAEMESFLKEGIAPKEMEALLKFEESQHATHLGLMALRKIIRESGRFGVPPSDLLKAKKEALRRLPDYKSLPILGEVIGGLAESGMVMSGYPDRDVGDCLRIIANSPTAKPNVMAAAKLKLCDWILGFKMIVEHREKSEKQLKELKAKEDVESIMQVKYIELLLQVLPTETEYLAWESEANQLLTELVEEDAHYRIPVVHPAGDPNIVRIDLGATSKSPTIAELARNRLRHRVNSKLEDFQVKLLNGDTWKLSEQRGKLVFIQFSYTGCGPCKQMYPMLQRLSQQCSDKLSVLTIMKDDDPKDSKASVAENHITWPVACESEPGGLTDRWGIESFPTVYVVDQEGKTLELHASENQLETLVSGLISK